MSKESDSGAQIAALKERFAPLLEQTNELIRRQLMSEAPQSGPLIETLEKSRGKQLRPLMTYAIFESFGRPAAASVPLSAVYESVHVASLLHDDVIDQCRQRRDMPTMNDLFGDGVAILLGDLVFVAIYRLAAAVGEIWLIEKVSDTVKTLIEGELLQQQNRFDPEAGESAYIDVIARKTAALLELCCYGAARMCQATEEDSLKLQAFGREFGIIFQMVDDWADFSRSRLDDHKDRGVDIANGFVTLPWLCLLGSADGDEKAQLLKLIGSRQPAGLGNPLVASLAAKYDLADQVAQRIHSRADAARQALAAVQGEFECSALNSFIDFILVEFHKVARAEAK